jgi:hypothetical protein
MDLGLAGRKVLVTGGTKGIGRDPGCDGYGIGDIQGLTEGALAKGFDGLRHLGGVAGADGDDGAFCHEEFGDGAADALGAASNQNLPARQTEIHVRLLPNRCI